MSRPVIPSMKNVFLFALLSAAAPILARAAGEQRLPTCSVHFAELNLDSAAGTEFLYRRIRSAAQTVCRGLEGREISRQAAHARCEEEAIEHAVTEVGHPRLTAYYSKLNHGRAPAAAFNTKSPEKIVRVVAGS